MPSINLGSSNDIVKAVKRGDVIVVIDVLRCSSSIITILAAGAAEVIPVRMVRDAVEISRTHPGFVLAGEREGVPPPGFRYGNSPSVFSNANLDGTHLILTTTNGTAAISKVRGAKHVLIGAFLNARVVAESAYSLALKEGHGVTLALSGTRGGFSLEDFLGAGAIAVYFPENGALSDAAQAATLAFREAKLKLLDVVKQGSHAKYLISIGLEEDVNLCCQLNSYLIVPYLKKDRIITNLKPKNLKNKQHHNLC